MARIVNPQTLIRDYGEHAGHAAWQAVVADSIVLLPQAHADDCPVRWGVRTHCAYGGRVCVSDAFHVRLVAALAAGLDAIREL